jgi:predicted nucleic acid-binding protein
VSGVFVDTSAVLALLVPTDRAHSEASAIFERLGRAQAPLVTTSYVLVETYALLGRRLGLATVERFRADFAPLLEVTWIGEDVHERALDLLAQRRKRQLSLVDATSFVVIADLGIERVFAFDRHFTAEGLPVLEI